MVGPLWLGKDFSLVYIWYSLVLHCVVSCKIHSLVLHDSHIAQFFQVDFNDLLDRLDLIRPRPSSRVLQAPLNLRTLRCYVSVL